jgi:hypothetical protein
VAREEVKLEDWPAFCEQFTRQHKGWLVTLKVIPTRMAGPEDAAAPTGSPPIVREQPLEGLIEDRASGESELVILVGQQDNHVSHLIRRPTRLVVQTGDRGLKSLRIDSRYGMTTFLEFRVAAPPETLDGLAESER